MEDQDGETEGRREQGVTWKHLFQEHLEQDQKGVKEALFQGHTGDVGRQSQQSPAHLVGPGERQIWGRTLMGLGN